MFSLILSVLTLTIQVEELVEPSPGPPVWIEGSSEEPSITDRISTLMNSLTSSVQQNEYITSLEVENGMLTIENFALTTYLTHMTALFRFTDENAENAENAAFMSVLMLSCLLSFVCYTRYSNKIATTPVVVSAEPIVVASDIKRPET